MLWLASLSVKTAGKPRDFNFKLLAIPLKNKTESVESRENNKNESVCRLLSD